MKYHKIIQKPYCCVGACLEMILRRHGITNYDQEKIASELGLIVPADYKEKLPMARIGEMPAAGYGTQIQEEQYSINHFLEKHNLGFIQKYHYITGAEETKKFLNDNASRDILIILHCGTLYDKSDADWGHAILLDHAEGDQVVIQENSPKRDLETVSLSQLMRAIQVHGQENGAGFYLIESS